MGIQTQLKHLCLSRSVQIKMSWFCKSSRKKSKTSVGNISLSKDDLDPVLKATFSVVLQDFDATVTDELTVGRGQVVEQLHTDRDWVYVRNVDGQCGYIPRTHCHPLDQIKEASWNGNGNSKAPKLRPRPRTIHMDELSLSVSQTFTGEQSPSGLEQSHQNSTPATNIPSTGTELQPTGSGDNDHSCVERTETDMRAEAIATVPQPTDTTQQLSTSTQHHNSTSSQHRARRRSHSQTPGSSRSYQEAVVSADKNLGLAAGRKPSESRKQQHQREVGGHCERLESYQSVASHISESSIPDDVFLPETRKPLGIYRCLEAYSARFKGELSLRENELVIVLEFGRGEWAWAITSSRDPSENTEGLVPKHLLAKYCSEPRSAECAHQSTVATQTELVVNTALRQLSNSSGASASNASDASSNASAANSPRPKPRLQHSLSSSCERQFQSTAVQTEVELQYQSQEWFKSTSPSQVSDKSQIAATAISKQGPPCSLAEAKFPSENSLECPKVPSSPQKKAIQTSRSIDFEADERLTTVSLRRRVKPTTILMAARDFIAPTNAKNCLSLKKGDILYLQTHVHYPHGWMWVYHPVQKSFGYVPRNHIACMYLVQRKPRQSGATVEDAV